MEKEDERCCGTGHCMINAEGQCWCGQQWDGEKMCMPKPMTFSNSKPDAKTDTAITSSYIALDSKHV